MSPRVARDYRPSDRSHVCPKCAGPKYLQSRMCRECWRTGLIKTVVHGTEHGYKYCRCDDCAKAARDARRARRDRERGGPPEPRVYKRPAKDHPWRGRKVSA